MMKMKKVYYFISCSILAFLISISISAEYDKYSNIPVLAGKRYVQTTLEIFGYDYIPDEGYAFSDPSESSPPYVEFTDSSRGTIYLWNTFADYYVDFTYTVDEDTVTLFAANNDTFGGTEKIVFKYVSSNDLLEVIDLNMPSNRALGWTVCRDIFIYDSSSTAALDAENEYQNDNMANEDTSIWSAEVTFDNTPETETETITIPDDFDVTFETVESLPEYKGICTPEQLDAVRYDLSGKYILLNDIDMAEWGNWEPIGKRTLPFTGIFDGNGYCIQNLTLEFVNIEKQENQPTDYCGLFANISKAEIRNLYLENALYNINSLSPVIGGIVGITSEYSLISNCHFNGTILCRSDDYSPAIGGIAGISTIVSNIEYCSSEGSIEVSSDLSPMVGGIIGECIGTEIDNHDVDSVIRYCFSNCNMTSLETNRSAWIGGIAGMVSIGEIHDCYYTGKITILDEKSCVGGIVGVLNGSVNNCYSIGEIINDTSYRVIGGIIGSRILSFAENPVVTQCYILAGVYENGIGKDEFKTASSAIQSLSDAEMKNANMYTGWDFESAWLIDPTVNNGYPTLRFPESRMIEVDNIKSSTKVDITIIIVVTSIILAFGIIVFIVLKYLHNGVKKKTVTRKVKVSNIESNLKCKNCGYQNEHGSEFCGNCGTILIVTKTPKEMENKCPRCGDVLEVDAMFCGNCGLKIEMNKTSNSDAIKPELASNNQYVQNMNTVPINAKKNPTPQQHNAFHKSDDLD